MGATRVNRIFAYIDGWNFYCAINEPGRLRYGWCNFQTLCDRVSMRRFGEKTRTIKYINTPVDANYAHKDGELARSKLWFRALEIETGIRPLPGRFQRDPETGRRREKEADIRLAVEMLSDADQYDTALLLSADTDFKPLVRKLCVERRKTVVVCYLEKGHAAPEADPDTPNWTTEPISDALLQECRLKDRIVDPKDGSVILWDHYFNLRLQGERSYIRR